MRIHMAMDIGAELRTAREAKGLSLGTLAQRIRVQPRTLAAIEINDLASLPPRPFGRGFVKAYAEEVDLDPDQMVQSFFAQFPARPAPPPTSIRRDSAEDVWRSASPWTGLATAALILILVVAAAILLGRRNQTVAETNAVGTSGASTPPATPASAPAASAPAASTPAASTPAAPAPPPAPAAPVRLSFSVTRPCWVTAAVDGQRVIYRIVQPGEPQSLNAEKEIVIRYGDAGSVTWSINDRQGTPLGGNGAIRDLRITPENAATVR
jgi:cytoskeleton protein RodZ